VSRKGAATARIRLVFADEGQFHHETVHISEEALGGHLRLIDALREDEGVAQQLYIDVDRLVSAYRLGADND
jgi:hypothetical protein